MILLVSRHECRVQSGRMSKHPMLDRQSAEEVAQIEHELEILRTRYALMDRWGRVVNVFIAISLPLTLIGITIYELLIDVVFGLFIFGIGAVAAGALWIICDTAPNRELDRTDAPPSQF